MTAAIRVASGIVTALTVAAAVPRAQTSAALTAFDAVSIKLNTSGAQARSFRRGPGQLAATNVTVRHVMWNAYGIQDFQIVGGPGWLGTDRFDIVARAEGNPPPDQMRQMLRTMLADRFKLVVHRATQQLPIYALVLARPGGSPGPSLRPAGSECADGARGGLACGFTVGNGSIASRNATMERIAAELVGFAGRQVIDRTGLTGSYDVELRWSPELQPDASLPSLFTALQEQLGLKLESARGPVVVVVIDSVEKPTED